MLAVNYSDLKGNSKKYFDMVCDSYETLIVTRKSGGNVVVMSKETYNKANYTG